MKYCIFVLFLLTIPLLLAKTQPKYTISGIIRDSITGEALIGAYITLKETQDAAVSNNYGFYSLTLPAGKYTFHYNFLGYAEKEVSVALFTNRFQNVELRLHAVSINEVTVTQQTAKTNVTSSEMSVQKLNVEEVKTLPVLFGEQDIMKTIQLFPGVKSAGEGNSGFYVRGGTSDQNLVLLDDAPIYNTSHLLGFFSIFNSDAIKDVKLFKGGIPAEFGGRLSSVVDIRMNDGNSRNYSISGGLGLISSRLTIEGPLFKNKGSFIISGRRTYADLFLKFSKDTQQNRSTLYFFDLNAKLNYSVNRQNHIYGSGYFGRDVFNFARQFGIDWGNKTSTLRWNHLFSDKLFLNSSFFFSDYNYKIMLFANGRQLNITSEIRDFSINEAFQMFINPQHTRKFGFSSTFHIFSPGSLKSVSDATINNRILDRKTALESSIYISDDYKILPSVTINTGIRFSSFALLGPGTFYNYDSIGNRTDSLISKRFSLIKHYVNWEPRLSITYLINSNTSIKTSYSKIDQYLNLLFNANSGNPTDFWLPSSLNIKPQIANQWVLGFFKNLYDNKLESSIELYYKTMSHLIDYKNGADIILNPDLESQLIYGKGWAYGIEFYLRKKEGKLNGWISYTLSRTRRQFADVNNNHSYPAKQDRIHDISLVGVFQITKKWALASTWVFNSGDAVTFPNGSYEINGITVPYYTQRNGYRMPDYHRLDISATNTRKFGKNRERSWNFSIYNIYARKNAYAINFRPDPYDKTKMQAVRLSLFSIIPSITYNFKF